MKITYLTKCPNCGGSIDEEFSKFCPFCGNSLAKNEPMSREERLKMYEYEDQTVPQKRIVINGKSNSNNLISGIVFLIMGVIMIIIGIFFSIGSLAVSFAVSFNGYGSGYDFLFGIVVGMMTFLIFGGVGLLFAVPGIIMWILYATFKREYEKMPDNPDEVIEGMVRRFEYEKAGKQGKYYVYVRVENPKPMVLQCEYFDLKIKDNLRLEQKVKIYRKENKYILRL